MKRMENSKDYQKWHIVSLSANSITELNKATRRLVDYLKKNPRLNFDDTAYTLKKLMKPYPWRRFAVCSNISDAINILSDTENIRVQTASTGSCDNRVVFMFPGLGGQYVNMGLELYNNIPGFRHEMDRCFDMVNSRFGIELKNILYSNHPSSYQKSNIYTNLLDHHHTDYSKNSALNERLHRYDISQLVMYIFEYSLAQMIMKLGVNPDAMIGYSMGEYLAACMANVFSLEDALEIMNFRGKLIQKLPPGGMISAPIPRNELETLLETLPGNRLSIAIDNGGSCILSGSMEEIDIFEKELKKKKYICANPGVSRALHSRMMDPILYEFKIKLEKINLKEPQIPYISNVTGDWIKKEQARNPGYWTRHLRQTVRFADGIQKLKESKDAVFLEVGPGRYLTNLIKYFLSDSINYPVINMVKQPGKRVSDLYYLMKNLGKLWLSGLDIAWEELYAPGKRCVIYSFKSILHQGLEECIVS